MILDYKIFLYRNLEEKPKLIFYYDKKTITILH